MGRPPDMDNRSAILVATRELLAEVGYADLTIDSVAKRAGLYRNLIYRAWGGKPQLVRDALFSESLEFGEPDTGTVEGDMRELLESHIAIMSRPAYLRGFPALVSDIMTDVELALGTYEMYARPMIEMIDAILERAVIRREIDSKPAADGVMLMISGAAQQIMGPGRLRPAEAVEQCMRMLFGGLLRPPSSR